MRKYTLAAVAILGALWVVAAFPGEPAGDSEPITPVLPFERLSAGKVELGGMLFGDVRLSGDQSRSCASCHDIASNGAGSQRRHLSPRGTPLKLNTPTLFNAAHNFRLNWSGRFRTLEEQADASLRNPDIMNADTAEVVRRLRADRRIAEAARRLYGRDIDRAILLDALAAYERSLVTPGSRFDRWLAGDARALTPQELRGYRTFKTAGCVSCHQGANVGGNIYQRSGIFEPAALHGVDRLRVPSLRNVAATAPYFHDGSATTLAQAIESMGRAQLGVELDPADVADISAFLETLTGFHDGKPVSVPGR
ncbi:cytochrome-c peroxidase [Pseudoxanthomonas putridarboris]|uniref:Cytochrome c peroxidase n=1 Tax=Pseudoxanthomonas putridarboris TaxID=752605 RepID=A0ABU9J389_9GAMM